LLAARSETELGPRAWRSIGEVPLTGLSHGAAGIASTLVSLYRATGDRDYLAAAEEGVRYERALFDSARDNWLDLRSHARSSARSFANGWCNGAPGIGLSRLGMWPIVDCVSDEIEAALRTTRSASLDSVDHLCCGNFGRLDLFVTAAEVLGRPALLDEARRIAARLIERARVYQEFQIYPDLPATMQPLGVLQGLAGVGYELLRLARPAEISSILLPG
jgi:lantibiotic modifying enzyme